MIPDNLPAFWEDLRNSNPLLTDVITVETEGADYTLMIEDVGDNDIGDCTYFERLQQDLDVYNDAGNPYRLIFTCPEIGYNLG